MLQVEWIADRQFIANDITPPSDTISRMYLNSLLSAKLSNSSKKSVYLHPLHIFLDVNIWLHYKASFWDQKE